jgi:hypothetical protein
MNIRDATTLHRTADHEASHAVVATLLGVEVKRVEVGDDLESGRTLHVPTDINREALIILAPAAFDGRLSDADERDFAKLCQRDPSLRQRRQHLLGELGRMRRETDANRLHDFFRNALITHRRIVNTGGGNWEAAR